MSGHSKWSNIKHKKGKADAQRGKVFTKIGREIAMVVKNGGSDPVSNSLLRDTIAKAKAANMPNDSIDRSIKRASGELGNVIYEEVRYEGYAPGGVAVIVQCVTDNRNRTASEVRHIFDKYGGNLGTTGCVSYMFDEKGVLVTEKTASADDAMMAALDAGAEDFSELPDAYEILTAPADFSAVRDALAAAGFTFLSAETEFLPQNTVTPQGEQLESVLKLIELLDDMDDVTNLYHNAELPEEPDED